MQQKNIFCTSWIAFSDVHWISPPKCTFLYPCAGYKQILISFHFVLQGNLSLSFHYNILYISHFGCSQLETSVYRGASTGQFCFTCAWHQSIFWNSRVVDEKLYDPFYTVSSICWCLTVNIGITLNAKACSVPSVVSVVFTDKQLQLEQKKLAVLALDAN